MTNIANMEAGLMKNIAEMEAGLMKNISEMESRSMKKYCWNGSGIVKKYFWNGSGIVEKHLWIWAWFSNKLTFYTLRRIVELPRRIVRAELSCAELSGQRAIAMWVGGPI